MPPKFQALSSSEQLRVYRFLTQGESPHDRELAAVTLEVGEHYQAQPPIRTAVMRWGPIAFSLFFGAFTISGTLDGEIGYAILFALIVLGVIGNLMLNPASRPKNVARSVEASRRSVAQMASREDSRNAASGNVRSVDHLP
jgi:hypothetical protein